MTIWTIKKGMERRFLAGHPWVYSNELTESPKGIKPGAEIELRDARGQFLALGFGNPSSLISFRAITRKKEPVADVVRKRLREAWEFRKSLTSYQSFRWVHAEADHFPGLVLDYYSTAQGGVLAAQLNTAASESLLPMILELAPHRTTILHRSANVRKLEGLDVREAEVLGAKDIGAVQIEPGIELHADLVNGQKTGLFLDQLQNIDLVARLLQNWGKKKAPRILDLCCYVGQWSAILARRFPGAEVTAFDASKTALEFARKNVPGKFTAVQGDIMDDLVKFKDESFDLVICDPPALIKNRKDIAAGARGYAKINAESLRILAPGGAIVSCSCSGLLDETEFQNALARAAQKSGREVRWIGRGGFSVDHPKLAEFSEGSYLKVWVGARN